MNFSEVEILLKELKDKPAHLDELEWWIGKNKLVTNRIASHVQSTNPNSLDYLQLCSLLLLEHYDLMVGIIRNILINNPNRRRVFLSQLLHSPYYYQRMSIPSLIIDLDHKDILLRCFQDKSGAVIREAANSLKKYKSIPFSQDELLDIAMNLNNHQYDYIQCTVPEVLTHISKKTFLISEICCSKSWRKRLAISTRVDLYGLEEREIIYSLLHKDPEETIRTTLVEKIFCIKDNRSINNEGSIFETFTNNKTSVNKTANETFINKIKHYIEIFMKDPSEKVRRQVIKVIGNYNEYQDILEKAVNDPSWIVRKELLCIHNENIYETISLPLITSLPNNFDWRIKIEILESISQIAKLNSFLIQRCLKEVLFEYLSDKVSEIRNKTSEVIQFLVENTNWIKEWENEINLVLKKDYLKRMNVVPICTAFDKKFKTSFTLDLLKDKVPNVRLKTLESLKKEEINEEVKKGIEEMEKDEYIEKEMSRLI